MAGNAARQAADATAGAEYLAGRITVGNVAAAYSNQAANMYVAGHLAGYITILNVASNMACQAADMVFAGDIHID